MQIETHEAKADGVKWYRQTFWVVWFASIVIAMTVMVVALVITA